MQTVLIDYGAGNLHSVEKAFRHVAGNGQDIIVSNHANVVGKADRIVLPGVGAFADCVKGIHAIPGMRETLEEQVIGKQKPFMGICVGMQVMLQQGLEHGEHEGLGWFKGTVKAITPKDPTHKIPH
ncbi:MAG: glutamine amidotransferase-related protein, partial [Rickettsiales bacterium]